MPKLAQHRLVWSVESGSYQLYYPEGAFQKVDQANPNWFEWLNQASSFSFQGQAGRLNLLKEARGDETYWYAYRRQGRRTTKKYVGHTSRLTISYLEELAASLRPSGSTEQNPLEDQSQPDKTTSDQAPVREEIYPLLLPKLSLPRLHSGLIERPHLITRLDKVLDYKLTLVLAPAGFGKTTLVRQWLAARNLAKAKEGDFPPVSWLSLEAGDNDPGRFWRYLITACQTFHPAVGGETLNQLKMLAQPPFEKGSLEQLLITLLNELFQTKSPGILVLEDLQHLTSPYLHQTLEFFLDHLPSQLHVIIITRSEPLLPLARWRALNELNEVRSADLRFTVSHTKAFFEQSLNLTLPGEALARLDEKLEGWVAGLRLLALALPENTSLTGLTGYLENFEIGSQQLILEYFVSEVLNAQSPEVQTFLLHTGLLDRLNGSLCQAITGNTRSGEMLLALAQANLFLEMSGSTGQWYRYHPLFAEAMRHEARQRLGQEELRKVFVRASQWYEDRAMLAEAIEAALQAHDQGRAARLIEQIIDNQSSGTPTNLEMHTLRRWVEQIPESILNHYPLLRLHYALALLFLAMPGQPSPVSLNLITRSLTQADEGFQALGNTARRGEVAAFRGLLARQRGAVEEAVSYANQALAWLPPEELAWRSWSLGVLGIEAFFAGELTTARTRLLEARALGEIEGNQVYLRANAGMLSGVYGASGELQQAALSLCRVLEEARAENDLDDIAHAQLGLANLTYEWNQLDAAQQSAQEAFELAQHYGNDQIEVGAVLLLAQLEAAQGQTEAALQRVAGLLVRLQPESSPLLYRLHREALAAQAGLHLLAGNLWSTQQWQINRQADSTSAPLPFLQREQEEILTGRILIAQGHLSEAITQLEPLREAAESAGRRRNAMRIQLLLCLAYAAQNQGQVAGEYLLNMLTFAQSQGYIRLFVDEGPALEKLLRRLLSHVREKQLRDYLETVLRAFAPVKHLRFWSSPVSNRERSLTLAEPLTRQEEKVLRLLAAGQSNPEIARELVVSINTVRTQVQSIYRKLAVNNRRAAGEMARRLKLL
jgi:LuxR family maltose regulon positive regulatory protein